MTENINKVVAHIRRTLTDLSSPLSDSAYQYAALPLCVMDSVYSIGVRYESTRRTVHDWCVRYHWRRDRDATTVERTITDFVQILRPYENRWEDMAKGVFRNRQRTSTRSGILKAEAVYRFSKALQRFGIEIFADALRSGRSVDLERAIKSIPGQGSGLSLKYFLILAGHEDGVKPDRMVTRFIADALGMRDVPLAMAEGLVREASRVLRPEFPMLMPSTLDNKIWEYQRNQQQPEKALGNCGRH
jgi:hypothetical protein